MAKINEILVNGVLTQVTEFDHTAQAIDDAVSIVGTSPAETRLNIGAASNPNLLDNWYFGNPVDQRGGYVVPPNTPYWSAMVDGTYVGTTNVYHKATANALRNDWYEFTMNGTVYYVDAAYAVRGYVGAAYTIDRWKLNRSDGIITIEPDGVLFIATGSAQLSQWLENSFETLSGKTLTVSAIIDGELISATGTVPAEKPTSYLTLAAKPTTAGIVCRLGYSTSKQAFEVRFNFDAAGSAKITAAKLELGSQQTLAHKDANGNWVLNEIPDYGEELAKCQRYFVKFDMINDVANFIGVATVDSTNQGQGFIVLPTAMRATPVLTGLVRLYNFANNSVADTVSVMGISGNLLRFNYGTSDPLDVSQRIIVVYTTNLSISSDL